MRQRQRGLVNYSYKLSTGYKYTSTYYTESFNESAYPGSNNCLHTRFTPASGSGPSIDGTGTYIMIENEPCPFPWAEIVTPLTPKLTGLNWDKLPTSTKASIIQILAELDETVAMFTHRFWRQLSYGSLNWGVLPFVNDLKAVLQAVNNLSKDLSNFSYEDQQVVPININRPEPYGFLRFEGNAKLRHTGYGDLSFQEEGSILLDRLGFHPDLATLWDLVPFSFVVDYLFPIGRFLESLRGGGWVKAMSFGGWVTIKVTGQWTIKHHSIILTGDYSGFQRYRTEDILVVELEPSFEFQAPSLIELFNTLYILMQMRK